MNFNPLATYVKERQGKRVIRKILISNNGMAAAKAILSMRRWTFIEFGSEQIITFVAMATQDDLNANAEFIRMADSFIEVPSGKNVNNYANVDLICWSPSWIRWEKAQGGKWQTMMFQMFLRRTPESYQELCGCVGYAVVPGSFMELL
ncbi:unnamed protein product [Durusdinium trenchii]|uniref:Biotin carboxylation domain-containing protein n=1 Tax=Durusdinium trenchii TaxID=1381693 RepID=A0ABP0NSP4_9DINO